MPVVNGVEGSFSMPVVNDVEGSRRRQSSQRSRDRSRRPRAESVLVFVSMSDQNSATSSAATDNETSEHLLRVFKDTSALLEGHFQLTSGLHSSRYLQCALVLQYPEHAEWVGREIASRVRDRKIDVVVAPAVGGIIVAHETARALGVRAIFTEREEGRM